MRLRVCTSKAQRAATDELIGHHSSIAGRNCKPEDRNSSWGSRRAWPMRVDVLRDAKLELMLLPQRQERQGGLPRPH